ncbi:MAG: hypothetical protein MUC34_21655 [Anaerolineae bacterium]|jgi:hypothetical protein|nr:hypothetical protein [Anaerolineae bacterium]
MGIVVARDLAIIVLALESIVVGVLLAILVIQVMRLVRLLREEVLPILRSTQDTVSTVRGTTDFMADHLVQPVVKASSYAAGARQAINTLFGRSNGRH